MRSCAFIFKNEEDSSYRRYSGNKGPGIATVVIRLTGWCLERVRELFDDIVCTRFRALTMATAERLELAQKQNISIDEAMQIMRDPNPMVRLELAWNGTAPRGVLKAMIRDRDKTVATVARRRLIKSTADEIKIPERRV